MTAVWRARAIGAATVLAVAAWLRCGPLPPGLLDPAPHVSTVVVDRADRVLYESISARGTRQRATDAAALPDALVRATLAAEDARFFHHVGIDPFALLRAMAHNARAGRMVEGGSTLTQQAVKMLVDRPRTARGKVEEAVLALRLEHRLAKDDILALYLSIAPYGNGLTGAEAASRAYFGVAADDLTPAQAALLAGLPQRPSALDPYRHLDRAVRRQRWILGRMEGLGFLSHAEAERARAERLRLRPRERPFAAPHFVERVRREAGARPPRRIETTLDLDLQARVAGIVDAHRERLRAHGAHNVAVAVLRNDGAEWLAWEGSGDYMDEEHGGRIDGVGAPRQPGSAVKPFTYALAFERGFTPATVLPDVPSHFQTAVDGVLYSPRNYDGVFRGPMRARLALAGSENVPAVWTLSQVGVADLLRLLRRAGVSTLSRTADHYGYALTMGDAEVRLDEMVAAYAAFARGGEWVAPRAVRGGAPAAPIRLVSARTAFWITDVLSDPDARAYAFGAGGSLDFPFPVAVKTGTSQGYRDNWTIGYTREVTVGVWVGNFDRTPLRHSSGVTGAAPIFHDVLLAAQQAVLGRLPTVADPALAAPPAGIESRQVCALSGQGATPFCPRVALEWLPETHDPGACRWHVEGPGAPAVRWPAPYRAWARAHGLRVAAAPLPARRAAARDTRARGLAVANPPDGATYLHDPTLRPEFQTLPLRAHAEAGPLSWSVDGRPAGTSAADGAVDWPLAHGPHTITVTDARGRSASARILVR
jgi:penicillin-binding protein 1C